MDEFSSLEELSEKETLERLESLFESSLPSLDSPILNDAANAASSILEATSSGSMLLDNATDGDLFGQQQDQQQPQQPPSIVSDQQASSSESTTGSGRLAGAFSSIAGSSSATTATTTPTPAAAPTYNKVVTSSTPGVVQQQQPVQQVYYAAKTTSASAPTANLVVRPPPPHSAGTPQLVAASSSTAQANLILSPQPVMTMVQQQTPTVIQQGGIQYTLQPSAASAVVGLGTTSTTTSAQSGGGANAKTSKQQPQLLPKPVSVAVAPTPTSAVVSVSSVVTPSKTLVQTAAAPAAAGATVTASPQLVLNAAGGVLTQGATPTGAPFLLTTATTGQASQPILIQQPGGNPILVMRPPAPTAQAATAAIVPTIVSSATGPAGTIVLQPPQPGAPGSAVKDATRTAAGMITPQVKIITPQGRMQMQQIQTPTGPKLIMVEAAAQQAMAAASSAGGATAPLSSPTFIVSSTSASAVQPAVAGSSTATAGTPGAATPSTPTLPADAVKAAKKAAKKKMKAMKQQGQKSGLDLGELMKDVGLGDLEGGGGNSSNNSSSNSLESPAATTSTMVTNVIGGTSAGNISLQTTGLTLAAQPAQPGAATAIAQIPQPMSVQAASNQFQLVQGPDGQFMLQSAAAASPAILTTPTAITGDGMAITSGGQLITASGGVIGTVSAPGGVVQGQQQQVTMTMASTPTVITGQPTANMPSSAISVPGAVVAASTSGQISPKKVRPNQPDPNRTPLYVDDRLPSGWHRKVSQRKSGASAGRFEVFIIGPTGKRFRSRNELKAFFEKTGESDLTPEDFDFSTFGTNVVTPHKTSEKVAKQNQQQQQIPMPIQQQPPVAAASVPMGAPSTSTLGGLQQQQQHPATFNSQLSMETAEADAQISQLLESLQKDSSKASAAASAVTGDSDKMSDIFQSLADAEEDDEEDSSDDGGVIKGGANSGPNANLSVIVSSNDQPSTSAGGGVPQMTSGTTGFQASFLNSIASPSPPGSEKSSPIKAPPPDQNIQQQQQPISGSPAGMMSNIPMGGASTQRRAVQSLPPNTKLVMGPNGQYSLQKVQTIELSQEMQNNLRAVQAKMQEIERKVNKTAKDKSDLAQLKVRQEQILASGKPVEANPVTQQVSLTTATSVVSSLHPSPSYISNLVPPASKSIPVPNVTVTNTTPIRPPIGQQQQVLQSPRPTLTPGAAAATAAGSVRQPTVLSTGGGRSVIPSLTDKQKRIVQEFKQKMALLPEDKHAAFIAQHKAGLMKQLNFQPSQLRLAQPNAGGVQVVRPGAPPLQGAGQQQQPVQLAQPPTLATPTGSGPVVQPGVAAAGSPGGPPVLQPQNVQIPMLPTKPLPPGTLTTSKIEAGQQQPPRLMPTAVPVAVVAPQNVVAPPQSVVANNNKKNRDWVESQVRKDQNEAVKPNLKLPFKSREDACKRLLRYHVFHELGPSPDDMWQAEDDFEDQSNQLIDKYKDMLSKYHYLLMHESMRMASSSEEVMLGRLWDSDERQHFAREKEEVKNDRPIELTMLTSEQRAQYKEFLVQKEEAEAKAELESATEAIKAVDDDEDTSQPPDLLPQVDAPAIADRKRNRSSGSNPGEASGGRLGIKFSRSESGNWKKKPKLDTSSDVADDTIVTADEQQQHQDVSGMDDYYASIKDELNRYDNVSNGSGGGDQAPLFSQQQEKDVDFSSVVDPQQAMVDGDEVGDMGDMMGTTADEDDAVAAAFGADSVQNAINSILVDGGRIDTPDLNNITGLLDSMEDQDGDLGGGQQDPITEAAVNSIMQM